MVVEQTVNVVDVESASERSDVSTAADHVLDALLLYAHTRYELSPESETKVRRQLKSEMVGDPPPMLPDNVETQKAALKRIERHMALKRAVDVRLTGNRGNARLHSSFCAFQSRLLAIRVVEMVDWGAFGASSKPLMQTPVVSVHPPANARRMGWRTHKSNADDGSTHYESFELVEEQMDDKYNDFLKHMHVAFETTSKLAIESSGKAAMESIFGVQPTTQNRVTIPKGKHPEKKQRADIWSFPVETKQPSQMQPSVPVFEVTTEDGYQLTIREIDRTTKAIRFGPILQMRTLHVTLPQPLPIQDLSESKKLVDESKGEQTPMSVVSDVSAAEKSSMSVMSSEMITITKSESSHENTAVEQKGGNEEQSGRRATTNIDVVESQVHVSTTCSQSSVIDISLTFDIHLQPQILADADDVAVPNGAAISVQKKWHSTVNNTTQ